MNEVINSYDFMICFNDREKSFTYDLEPIKNGPPSLSPCLLLLLLLSFLLLFLPLLLLSVLLLLLLPVLFVLLLPFPLLLRLLLQAVTLLLPGPPSRHRLTSLFCILFEHPHFPLYLFPLPDLLWPMSRSLFLFISLLLPSSFVSDASDCDPPLIFSDDDDVDPVQ